MEQPNHPGYFPCDIGTRPVQGYNRGLGGEMEINLLEASGRREVAQLPVRWLYAIFIKERRKVKVSREKREKAGRALFQRKHQRSRVAKGGRKLAVQGDSEDNASA